MKNNSHTNNQIPLPTDSQLQHYKIIKMLGRGGFGISYLALDTQRNRPVVIKEYFPEHAAVRMKAQTQVSLLSDNKQNDFQEGLRRFEREAMVLSEFTHPNIVKVEAFFKDNNTAYFVMEFIDGESLQDTLDKKGSAYTEEELLNDVFPILEGLKEVHKKGMLHLDIKPDNILKTKYGQPVLIDFGGARFSTGQASQDHSSMVATAGYAPPEQYSLSQEQTPATDIYAFGMTLYQLMAPSEVLPDSKDRQNALLEDIPDPLKPIRQAAPGYSEQLYKVIEECTQIKKKDRPSSISSIELLLLKDCAEDRDKSNHQQVGVSNSIEKSQDGEIKEKNNNEHFTANKFRVSVSILSVLVVTLGIIVSNLFMTVLDKNKQQVLESKMISIQAPVVEPKYIPPIDSKDDAYEVKGGVVLHNTNNLMWMRCSLGQKWDGKGCSDIATLYKWENAKKAAKQVSYLGYSDWRLPTTTELYSLVKCSNGRQPIHIGDDNNLIYINGGFMDGKCGEGNENIPSINQALFPDTLDDNYWSGTKHKHMRKTAWSVFFNSGGVFSISTTNSFPVRLVRDI